MPDKATITLPGIVESIQKPRFPGQREKADIAAFGRDNFFQEIIVDNTLTQRDGHEVHLEPGAEVKVTIEAGPKGFRSEK